jgi:predicted DNA binding CopG/RHH family protein
MVSKEKGKWVPEEAAESTAHLDLKKAVRAPDMPKLKPSTAVMNLRVPESLLLSLKREANRRDVPYQSLVKILLDEKLAELNR